MESVDFSALKIERRNEGLFGPKNKYYPNRSCADHGTRYDKTVEQVSIASAVGSCVDRAFHAIFNSFEHYGCNDLRTLAMEMLRVIPATDAEFGALDRDQVLTASRVPREELIRSLELKHAVAHVVVTYPMLHETLSSISDTVSETDHMIKYHVGADTVSVVKSMDRTAEFPAGFHDRFAKKYGLRMKYIPRDCSVGAMVCDHGQVSSFGYFHFTPYTRDSDLSQLLATRRVEIDNALNSLSIVYLRYASVCLADVVDHALHVYSPALYRELQAHLHRASMTPFNVIPVVPESCMSIAASAVKDDVWQSASLIDTDYKKIAEKVSASARGGSEIRDEADLARHKLAFSIGLCGVNVAPEHVSTCIPLLAQSDWNDTLTMQSSAAEVLRVLSSEAVAYTLYFSPGVRDTHGACLQPIISKCNNNFYDMYFSRDPYDPCVIIKFRGKKNEFTGETAQLLSAYLLRQVVWSYHTLLYRDRSAAVLRYRLGSVPVLPHIGVLGGGTFKWSRVVKPIKLSGARFKYNDDDKRNWRGNDSILG
jgi:hypothetical protein